MASRGAATPARQLAPLELTGREAELAFLAAAARGTGADPRLVLLRGVAGSGRTALLDAVRRTPVGEGVVLYAAARDPGTPFGVAVDLLAPLGLDRLTAPQDRFASFNELICPILEATGRGPVTLLVDDADAADEPSLQWLAFLLRRVVRRRLMVVLALRPAATGPISVLAGEHAATDLRLGPLPDADVRRAVASSLGGPPDEGFTAACARMSGGGAGRLARLLAELAGRHVRPDAGAVATVEAVGRAQLAAEAAAYLDDRPAHVGVVLRMLAVLGPSGAGEPAMLPILCDLPDDRVAAAVGHLRGDGVLCPGSVTLAHPEFGRAVLAAVPPSVVDGLRRHAALVLVDQGVPALDAAPLLIALPDLSEQWMQEALCRAADAVRSDPDTAMHYLSRALDGVPTGTEAVVRLAETVAGTDPAVAMDFLTRAIDRISDVNLRARLAGPFASVALATRRAPEAFDVLHRMLGEFEAVCAGDDAGGEDHELLDRLRAATTAVGLSEESTTAELLARLPVPARADDGAPGGRMQDGLGAYTTMLGGRDADAVAALARRALVQGLTSRYPPSIIAAASALSHAGEPLEALAAIDRLLGTAAGATSWTTLSARATVLEGLGELADAAADAESAMGGAIEAESMAGRTVVPAIRLASVLVRTGRPDRAEALLGSARWPHFGWMYPQAVLVSAEVRRLRGDPEGALAVLLDSGRRLADAGVRNPVFAPWWLEAACLLAELGRADEAAGPAEYGEQAARDWRTPESAGLALMAAGVAARGRRAPALLAEAVDRLDGAPAPLSLARAEYLFGRALLAVDDAKGARTHLRSAIALAARTGYRTLGTAARDLLVSAGGRIHAVPGARRLGALSGSELRVAELAATGKSNREIAGDLFVSVRTVETHLSSVYRKLGIGLRDELPTVLATRSEGLGA